MFIVLSITFCLVFSLKCKSVNIDKRDSEEVPNIPRALIERLTNIIVIIIIIISQPKLKYKIL